MFFCSDEAMMEHKVEWDDYHIECPQRLRVILDKLEKYGLIAKSTVLPSRRATKEEIATVHDPAYIDKIESVCGRPIEDIEAYCKTIEDCYLNQRTFDLALMAAGCAIDATLAAFKDKSTAFTAVRPPGHHAFVAAPCGFCIFNNAVLAAKHARKAGAQRVLIVDWDVHAGQGTQECIEGDPGIRLISSHRFEQGQFWPNLPQSAVGHKFSNTINVPLNAIGEGDAAFLAIFHLVVLPTVIDYKPDLILVSCGFDAAIGDPEGEMAVSPYGYGTMTRLLVNTGLPVSVILEGGYFLPSVAEGAAYVVRALQGETFKQLPHQASEIQLNAFSIQPLSTPLLQTLYRIHSSSDSPSFRLLHKLASLAGVSVLVNGDEYKGTRENPASWETRNLYKERTPSEHQKFLDQLNGAVETYQKQGTIPKEVVVSIDSSTALAIVEDRDKVTVTTTPSFVSFVEATATEVSEPTDANIEALFKSILTLSNTEQFKMLPIVQLLTRQ